ncbi:hypothetical protein RKD26_004415 [Streptomyces calvus]
MRRVEGEQTGGERGVLRLPVLLPEPQQAHHQQQVPQHMAHRDIGVGLGEQGQRTPLPAVQHTLHGQRGGGRDQEQQHVRHERRHRLCDEGGAEDGAEDGGRQPPREALRAGQG